MTQFYYYRSAIDATAFSVGLGSAVIRLGALPGLTELAEHLQSGETSITLDDPNADVGHSGDAILGNQRFEINETACSAPKLYAGFIGQRTYQRGEGDRPSLMLGASRQITVELHDYNSYASMRVIPDTNIEANRPRETVSARFAWITGTGYLAAVSNTGYVVANSTIMDAADYRGQRPVNVLNDCELAAGFGWNCFIFWDDVAGGPAWFFDNANTSTAFSSTLRISNVLADLDTLTAAGFTSGTTFGPSKDAQLTRDPTELGDTAYLPYRNGAVNVTRAATTAIYGQKDVVAPNANVGTAAKARTIARDFLEQHKTEEDRITLTVELPPSKVNLIKAGHRIQVKFQHLPGYEDWTWCRVLRRAPGQTKDTDDRYEMELELSPQETGTAPSCSYDATPTGDFYPLGGYDGGYAILANSGAWGGVIYYLRPGIAYPTTPTAVPPDMAWHFWELGAGGAGSIDYAGDCAQNTLQFIVVGPGTMTVQTEIFAGGSRPMAAYWFGEGANGSMDGITSGESVEIDLTSAECVTVVRFIDGTGSPCGGKWGWSTMHWEAA